MAETEGQKRKNSPLKSANDIKGQREKMPFKSANDVKGQRKKMPFKSAKECERIVEKYFSEYLVSSGEIADIESLADYIGSTRDEMLLLMNDKRFGKTLKKARNRIAKIKKQLAFGGKIPAAVLSFDLKNNHGYRDKPDDENAGNQQSQVIFNGKTSEWAE